VDFAGALLAGLAADGGLYLPERWPTLDAEALRALRGRSYVDVAVAVLAPFVAPAIPAERLRALCAEAWASFDDPAVTPLRPLGADRWLLELFHGPTLAFKDLALQLVGRLFDEVLAARDERLLVVGATSGDTGSAAIDGCRGRDRQDIVILFPAGRTSEVQRRQMTTVPDPNVLVLAVHGTFDDCQELVKGLFRDAALRAELHLAAVNSINTARVLAQVVYYVTAAVALGAPDRPVDFVVPTGNFGDVLAGWCARRMGVPIRRLVVATNANDLLARTLASGRYQPATSRRTLSPSMDIQVASNFERILFEACGRDAARVRAWMHDLAVHGGFDLGDDVTAFLREAFDAGSADDDATLATMRRVHEDHGLLVDPHTAVGVAVGERAARAPGVPQVVLATAHPAKFPDAVAAATGVRPSLPPRLADLHERPERMVPVAVDRGAVVALLRAHVARRPTHAP
jgi:threonine synthase